MNLKVLLSSLSVSLAFSFAHGQVKVTIYGDENDSTIIARKKQLEERGLAVTVEPAKTDSTSVSPSSEHPFVMRHRGSILPKLKLIDIDGNIIDSRDWEGKLVHINFWSVTCKPCIEEFPELDRLKSKYEDEDAVFIAIAPESPEKVQKILGKHPLNYIVVADAADLFKEFGVDGYPKNLFIDREGMVVDATDGSHYKGGVVDGEVVMIPDNFPVYDRIMQQMTEMSQVIK